MIMIWWIVWVIIPAVIGLIIFGIWGAIGFAVLGILAYYVQRIATINAREKSRIKVDNIDEG
jgi:hypothetical protein